MNPLREERAGSEVDVKLLKALFTQLDYKIVERSDLSLHVSMAQIYIYILGHCFLVSHSYFWLTSNVQ